MYLEMNKMNRFLIAVTAFLLIAVSVQAGDVERRSKKRCVSPSAAGAFLEGSGTISVEFGKIHVKNASSGKVVIRYHWIPGLKAVPALPVKRLEVEGDPVGFIEINNGNVRDFALQ